MPLGIKSLLFKLGVELRLSLNCDERSEEAMLAYPAYPVCPACPVCRQAGGRQACLPTGRRQAGDRQAAGR